MTPCLFVRFIKLHNSLSSSNCNRRYVSFITALSKACCCVVVEGANCDRRLELLYVFFTKGILLHSTQSWLGIALVKCFSWHFRELMNKIRNQLQTNILGSPDSLVKNPTKISESV